METVSVTALDLQEAVTLPKRAVVNDLDKLFIGIN